jgi:hypothetical protein
MCFHSYDAQRSQTILGEYTPYLEKVSDKTELPETEQGDGHGKLITWLGMKLMGLPAPATSRHHHSTLQGTRRVAAAQGRLPVQLRLERVVQGVGQEPKCSGTTN